MDPGREGIRREDRLTTFGLLALLALWLLCTAGLRPLLLPDEGRYASVAREMLLGGAWVPTLDGLPFFHKPPLMYWIDIAAMQVFGVTAFAARFASIVGAWLMGAALWLGLRRWHDSRTAALALGVLATCPFFFVAAQYANHDMLVAGLITVAVLCFVRALDDDTAKLPLRWLVVGWVACALALLAKGLIGVVLPALVVGPWLLVQRRWRDVPRLLHPLALLAFAAVAGPWLIAMQLRYPGFFDYFIVEQHFRRYAQSDFNNVHPLWFFLVVLPALTLPWSGWLALGAWRGWRGLRAEGPSADPLTGEVDHAQTRGSPAARRIRGVGAACLLGLRGAPHAKNGSRAGLWTWWVVAVVGFFSLPSSKLVGYVLPALAPWCALIALVIVASAPSRRTVRVVALVAALICVGTVVSVAWTAPNSHRAAAQALAARLASGDKVAMVDDYLYDVPFYAGLTQPVAIASDWVDPDLPKHDNWRKELFDAARFDPERARAVLWPIARLDALACGAHAIWFVVRAGQSARVQGVPGVSKVYADKRTELWRAPGRSDCR